MLAGLGFRGLGFRVLGLGCLLARRCLKRLRSLLRKDVVELLTLFSTQS